MDLQTLIENLDRLNIDRIVKQSIGKTSINIAELNRKQLRKGIKADGTMLPNYSNASVIIYKKPPGPIQLYDTGDFQKNIVVDVSENEIEILSNDWKDSMLTYTYGGNILGLTPESNEKYTSENLLIEMQTEITNIFGLEFN